VQLQLETGQIIFGDAWYASPEGQHILAATDCGRYMFVWEALYGDGTKIRQFDTVPFTRAMTDESYVPPSDLRLSADCLDGMRVVQFNLYPIALVRKRCPWFQKPIEVRLKPSQGEFFLGYWLTDLTPKTGYTLCRHVIGLKQVLRIQELKTMVVLSPSGQITICSDDNQSFEGE